jgi:hypothetical protein
LVVVYFIYEMGGRLCLCNFVDVDLFPWPIPISLLSCECLGTQVSLGTCEVGLESYAIPIMRCLCLVVLGSGLVVLTHFVLECSCLVLGLC